MNFFKKLEKQTRTNLKHLERRVRRTSKKALEVAGNCAKYTVAVAASKAGEAAGKGFVEKAIDNSDIGFIKNINNACKNFNGYFEDLGQSVADKLYGK